MASTRSCSSTSSASSAARRRADPRSRRRARRPPRRRAAHGPAASVVEPGPHRAADVRSRRVGDGLHRDERGGCCSNSTSSAASKLRVVPHGAPAELYARALRRAPKAMARRRGTTGDLDVRTALIGQGHRDRARGDGSGARRRAGRGVRDRRTHASGDRAHRGRAVPRGPEGMVREHDLEDNVMFLDRFLDLGDLARLLAVDRRVLHALPPRRPDRVGSAHVRDRCRWPAVSTPYRYAQDLLVDGAGRLVPFGAAEPLADALIELLVKPEALEEARDAARRAGRHSRGRRSGGRPQRCFATRSRVQQRGEVPPASARLGTARDAPTRSCARRPRTCARWSTTPASSSTPTAGCRHSSTATASTTSPGFVPLRMSSRRPIPPGRRTSCARSRSCALRATTRRLRCATSSAGIESGSTSLTTATTSAARCGRSASFVAARPWPAACADLRSARCAARVWPAGSSAPIPTIRTSMYASSACGVGFRAPASATALLQRHVDARARSWRPGRRVAMVRGAAHVRQRAALRGADPRRSAARRRRALSLTGLAALDWLDRSCSDPSGVYRFPGNRWVSRGRPRRRLRRRAASRGRSH